MEVVPMKAERRTALGRNQLASLRQQGWLPAVVYGLGQEPVSIAVSEWELEQHVKAHHRVFQLDIAGAGQSAFLQEVSWHAVSDRPLHADFKRIDLTQPIETEVEIEFIGHPAGLSKGGTLMKDHVVIEVRCLPTQIPDAIEHDVSKLELDEFVLASQIVLPPGVTLITPPETTVCHVAVVIKHEVVEAPAEGAAAPAEGETPAAAPTPPKE
ncbi:MAG TPA: 50S ribosomal protein L25 [Planctomycetota bacterium]|nr:50S ribosomal protein L25 [Planctomycetota bacterium]